MIVRVFIVLLTMLCAAPALAAPSAFADSTQESWQHSVADAAFKKGDYAEAFRLLIILADDGVEPFVQRPTWHTLGEMFQNGWGVERNVEEALFWYKKTARATKFEGRTFEKLARIYVEGDGVPQDYAEAAKWYEKAADGSDDAKYALGFLYRRGLGVPKNYNAAFYRFHEAVGCNGSARVELAGMYLNGEGTRKSVPSAIIWWRRAAETNIHDGMAEGLLGYVYLKGLFVRKDYGQALIWLHRAAGHGFSPAQANLGWMYAHGTGVPRDYPQALALAKKAAEQGNYTALYLLGKIHERGWGVEKNDAEAFSYYLKAAEAGNSEAPARIATFYRLGRGVAKDLEQARVWHRKDKAQPAPLLAKSYAAPPDKETRSFGDERALKIRRQAERGNVVAQRKLGLIYLDCNCTFGGTKYEQARLWLSRAARRGDRVAIRRLAELPEKSGEAAQSSASAE